MQPDRAAREKFGLTTDQPGERGGTASAASLGEQGLAVVVGGVFEDVFEQRLEDLADVLAGTEVKDETDPYWISTGSAPERLPPSISMVRS